MVDKTRIGPLTEREQFLINVLSPKERKEALLKAAREKMQQNLQEDVTGKEWMYHLVSLEDITATDLLEVGRIASKDQMQVFHVFIKGHAERADAIYLPDQGRMGIAWGSDATWADVDSIESGIDMWLNDPEEWNKRN